MTQNPEAQWMPATMRGKKHPTAAAALAEYGPLMLMAHGANDGHGWWWSVSRDGRELAGGTDENTLDAAKAAAEHAAERILLRKRVYRRASV